MANLKLAIPSKGRLLQHTIDWFDDRELQICISDDREYSGTITGIDGVDILFMSASDIPNELASGQIHVGVTGTDLVHETLFGVRHNITELTKMGFGHANLIIAVPEAWVDVESMHDLDDVAEDFRRDHGMRLRIATKYKKLVTEYLTANGVANYQLVDSAGATEGAIKNLQADVIADITSSGRTLDANHLKIITPIPILQSQATLFASSAINWSSDVFKTLTYLMLAIN